MNTPASRPNRWAFKVRACDYLDHHDLEGLGLSADWYLYLSPVSPPSMDAAMQQMNSYSLLACPCCGGEATIIGYHLTNEWSAICRSCGLETAHKMEPAAAAADWNQRFSPDEEGHGPIDAALAAMGATQQAEARVGGEVVDEALLIVRKVATFVGGLVADDLRKVEAVLMKYSENKEPRHG